MTGSRTDSLRMFEATFGLPEQLESAAKIAEQAEGLPAHDGIENVVIVGMGGSGMVGDVLQATASPFMAVPLHTVKSYGLPAFVGEGSLVIAISFSGNTEETLEAVSEAHEDGASIVAITSGGAMAELVGSWGETVIALPSGIPQPRAGIGAMTVPALLILEKVGLFPGASAWIEETIKLLGKRRDILSDESGPAAKVAEVIGRTIPLIYGPEDIGAAAALRWKNQINENAKCPAYWGSIPEICHNELAGWGQHGDLTRQAITLVNLRHDEEHPQVSRRIEIVTEMMNEVVSGIVEIKAEGDGELAQLFDLMMFGDFVSLFMAFQAGIDPGPIPILDEMKERLRG